MRDLERELLELGDAIEYPATPNLAPRVRARLEERPARFRLPSRRALALAFVVLLVTVGALLAVPSTRSAIFEWLGIKGVAIERVETAPTAPPGAELDLGEPVGLEEAERRARYDVLVPAEFEAVYFREPPPGGQVSFVLEDAARPLLLTEFRGETLPFVQKVLGPGTTIEGVRVNGAPGAWIEGAPHAFVYVDERGNAREETLRLAGNVLLWEQGGLTLRIEGARSQEEALQVAASVR